MQQLLLRSVELVLISRGVAEPMLQDTIPFSNSLLDAQDVETVQELLDTELDCRYSIEPRDTRDDAEYQHGLCRVMRSQMEQV